MHIAEKILTLGFSLQIFLIQHDLSSRLEASDLAGKKLMAIASVLIPKHQISLAL